MSELLNGIFQSDEASIDNVDSIRLGISDVFLHEAPKA